MNKRTYYIGADIKNLYQTRQNIWKVGFYLRTLSQGYKKKNLKIPINMEEIGEAGKIVIC